MRGPVVCDGRWAALVCHQCKARGPKVESHKHHTAEGKAIAQGWRLWARPRGLSALLVCPVCARSLRDRGSA